MRRTISRWTLMGLMSMLLYACEDELLPPEPGPLELRIVSPVAEERFYEGDTVLFAGEATATDIGPLPDDSVWWTKAHSELARGRVLQHNVTAGSHVYNFHAGYGSRQDSATVAIFVEETTFHRVLWTVSLNSNGTDGLAMSPEGILYALDGAGWQEYSDPTVVAISPKGSILWRSQLGAFVLGGSPPAIGHDGTIHYGHWGGGDTSSEGGVVALRPDGSLKWVFDIIDHGPPHNGHTHLHGGVAVDGNGTVYFVTEEYDAPMYAVSPDGSLKWRVSTRPDSTTRYDGSPTFLIGDSLALATQRGDSIVALATETGLARWSAPLAGGAWEQISAAIDYDGTLYVARSDTFVALTSSGLELWRNSLPTQLLWGSPTLRAGQLYLATDAGGVHVFDLSGRPLAQYGSTGSQYYGVATIGANGVLYAAGNDTLYSYDQTGAIRFAIPVPHKPHWYSAQGGPLIGADGTVYFRASDLGVVAVHDTVGPATDADWPTYQGNPQRQGRRFP